VNFSKENLFDRWAKKYDGDVFESDHNNEYPFAGYSKGISRLNLTIGNARLLWPLYIHQWFLLTHPDTAGFIYDNIKIALINLFL